jgi:hypothetical protein
VLKALEKDRDRRYETATALAADVHRHLRDEPVQACPPSAAYRFRKFARRNRAALGAVAAVVAVVLSTGAALAVSYTRLDREQQETKKALASETEAKQELQATVERERTNLSRLNLALAHRFWLAREVDQARQHLRACPDDLRDREWHYVHRACHGELARLELKPRRLDPGARQVRYSHDGSLLAVVGPNCTVWVWDKAGQSRVILPGHQDVNPGLAVAFGRGGNRLVSAAVRGPTRRSGERVFSDPEYEVKVRDQRHPVLLARHH